MPMSLRLREAAISDMKEIVMTLKGIGKKAAVAGVVVAGTGLACTGALAWTAVAASRRRSGKSRKLNGKVVLITGSSRGLGLALAEEFGRKGANLALCARDRDELERVRKLLLVRGAGEDPEDIFISSHDLSEPQQAEQLIQEV